MYYSRNELFEIAVPAIKLKNYYNKEEDSSITATNILNYHKNLVPAYDMETGWYVGFRNAKLGATTAVLNDPRILNVELSGTCYYYKPEVGEILDFEVTSIDPKTITGTYLGFKVLMELTDLTSSKKYEFNSMKQNLVEKSNTIDSAIITVGSRLRAQITAINVDQKAPYKSHIRVSGKLPINPLLNA